MYIIGRNVDMNSHIENSMEIPKEIQNRTMVWSTWINSKRKWTESIVEETGTHMYSGILLNNKKEILLFAISCIKTACYTKWNNQVQKAQLKNHFHKLHIYTYKNKTRPLISKIESKCIKVSNVRLQGINFLEEDIGKYPSEH